MHQAWHWIVTIVGWVIAGILTLLWHSWHNRRRARRIAYKATKRKG